MGSYYRDSRTIPKWLESWYAKDWFKKWYDKSFSLNQNYIVCIDQQQGRILWQKAGSSQAYKNEKLFISSSMVFNLRVDQLDKPMLLEFWLLPLALYSAIWPTAAALVAVALLFLTTHYLQRRTRKTSTIPKNRPTSSSPRLQPSPSLLQSPTFPDFHSPNLYTIRKV